MSPESEKRIDTTKGAARHTNPYLNADPRDKQLNN
jgi:hypothetical protein